MTGELNERDMLIETVTIVKRIEKRLDSGDEKFDNIIEQINTRCLNCGMSDVQNEVTIMKTQRNTFVAAAGVIGAGAVLLATSLGKYVFGGK